MRRTGRETGERDRLVRVVAEAGVKLLQREGGDVAKVVWGLGGELLAPHIDVERVTRFFGEPQHRPIRMNRIDCEGGRAGGCRSRGGTPSVSSRTGTIAAPTGTRPRCRRRRLATSS